MRPLIVIAAILIAATGVTPFDLSGIDIGADNVGELTLSILVLIAMFFVVK